MLKPFLIYFISHFELCNKQFNRNSKAKHKNILTFVSYLQFRVIRC